MPKYGNFENGPVAQKLLSVVRNVSCISTPWDRKRIWETSGTFANGQVSCTNMAILKIGPHVTEPKFYVGTFDLLVFKVILG